jgi:hypothetical protein
MTEAHPAHSTRGASRDDEGATPALGLAEWLCLAATRTFAIMALLASLGREPQQQSRPVDWRATMWQDQLQGGDEVVGAIRNPR